MWAGLRGRNGRAVRQGGFQERKGLEGESVGRGGQETTEREGGCSRERAGGGRDGGEERRERD